MNPGNNSKYLLQINFEIISHFLNYSDWNYALGNIFELVGRNIDVDRIYYFENHIDSKTAEEVTSQRFEWVKNGIAPMIDNPELQNVPIAFVEDFMKPLKKNKPFEAIISELPEGNSKQLLSSQGILSILVLPIYIDNILFGFIGFDDCTSERTWTVDELHFLKSITSNLSSAIFRRNAMLEVESKVSELEKINQELEQFAYVASHDLQEPLRMVTEFLRLLDKKYSPILDEQAHKYIYYAINGATRMRDIINDLLDYSRIGRTTFLTEKVSMVEMITEIKELLAKKLEEKNPVILLHHEITFLTWKAPLHQVLLNLMDNSLKYSRSDRKLKIEISILEQPRDWMFTFSDNGIGIPPEYHEKIFQLFQRLHNRDEYEGTGIGLTITKKIIENMGGKIWLDSQPDEGTSFHFTIPKPEQLPENRNNN